MKKISAIFAIAGLAASLCATAQGIGTRLMGSATPAAQTERTIVVNQDTKWVNVKSGDVVKFVSGNTEFGWRFDGPAPRSFDLQLIAPAGAVSRAITVYVAPLPGHRS